MKKVTKKIDNSLKTFKIIEIYETHDYKVNITLVKKEKGSMVRNNLTVNGNQEFHKFLCDCHKTY